MALSDTPINKISEDSLNRAGFCKTLADTITNWQTTDSMVIGVFGSWGSGKTSILNMTALYIKEISDKKPSDEKPIIIEFNPWDYSERDVLLRSFLEVMFSTLHKSLPITKRNYKKQINGLAKSLGAFNKVPQVGDFLGITSDLLNLVTSDDTITNQKCIVDQYFMDLNRKVIIFIDDVDRLSKSEVRTLFQLIKMNADFLNTIYVIACDREVVEKALETEQGISGRAYMEKIIQVGFDIPKIQSRYIEDFLTRELLNILNTNGIDETRWHTKRWTNLYNGGLLRLFDSLRDVKRFINSTSFIFYRIANETNPVDLIGIEAIRVFSPALYGSMKNNKTLFTGSQNIFEDSRDTEEIKIILDKLFEKEGKHEGAVREICKQLFPQLRKAYPNLTFPADHETNWRESRRVCSPDIFDFYFVLDVPHGEISVEEIILLIEISNDYQALIDLFNKFIIEERILRLLDYLPDISGSLNETQILTLSKSLMWLGETVPNTKRGLIKPESDFQIAITLFNLLTNLPVDERLIWMVDILDNTQIVYMPIYLLWHDTPRPERDGINRLFTEEQYADLINRCLGKINSLVEQGQLLNIKRLNIILFRWLEWAGNREGIDRFISSFMDNPSDMLQLIAGFISSEGRALETGGELAYEDGIIFEQLSEFVSIENICRSISQITHEEVNNLSDDLGKVYKLTMQRCK